MRPDSPIPPDGSCAVCGQPRQPERSRKYAGAEAELDPFCSNMCARVYYGQPDLDRQGRERALAGNHRTRAHSHIVHGTRESYRTCACPKCVAAVKGAA